MIFYNDCVKIPTPLILANKPLRYVPVYLKKLPKLKQEYYRDNSFVKRSILIVC